MSDDKLLKPEPFIVTDEDGKEHKFILSNFPAVEGIEIVSTFPMSALPKIGDLATCQGMMLKIMHYVAVETGGTLTRLSTRDLVNNHCGDWATYAKVVWKMMEKNCSFFRDGRGYDFLESLTAMIARKISETLTHLSVQSSPTSKPPSNSSEPSTT